jgi:hypothetical protein
MRTHTQLKTFLLWVLIGLATLTSVSAHAQGKKKDRQFEPRESQLSASRDLRPRRTPCRYGKPDLIVESSQCCGSADGLVGVLLGKGDGTFKPVVRYQSVAGGQGSSVALADVNGDGKLDIVTTDQDARANGLNKGLVSLRLGNGDGTFQAEQTYDSGGFLTNSVAVADINGDGKPDLVVANICADNALSCALASVGVLLNNTTVGKSTASTSLTSP